MPDWRSATAALIPSWWWARRARISSGAFAGKTGILVKELTGLRVVLTVEAIMKSFSVEVDADELEMVG